MRILQEFALNSTRIQTVAGLCPADLFCRVAPCRVTTTLLVHFLSVTRKNLQQSCKTSITPLGLARFHFLRREERSKEASTPSKASPYMGRMQLIPRAGSLHQSFGMALEPLPFAFAQGSPCLFDADYAKRWSFSKTFLDEPSDKVVTCVPSVASDQRSITALRASCLLRKHSCVPSVASDQRSITALRASCFLVAILLENIPHEEVFRGMQIL